MQVLPEYLSGRDALETCQMLCARGVLCVRIVRRIHGPLLAIAALLALGPALAPTAGAATAPAPTFSDLMREGASYVRQGNLELALTSFGRARALAPDPEARGEVDGEEGAALVSAGRFVQAQPLLKRAYEAGGKGRAARAIDLGNLALAIHKPEQAGELFLEARKLAVVAGDSVTSATAALGLARSLPAAQRLPVLEEVNEQLNSNVPRSKLSLARLQVNLGHQARGLGQSGQALARASLARAVIGGVDAGNARLQAEALTELALLEESAGHAADSLQQARQALDLVYRQPPATVTDLKISLEHLQGRLLRGSHNAGAALVSYEQAAEAIESVRAEMPIEDEDGRSTYETTIDPVTRGLVGLLVDQAMLADATQGESFLRRAVDAEERMHQAEMQDFLGDRCTVESNAGESADRLDAGVAVIYPLVLEDRVELLMRTAGGITHRRIKVTGAEIGAVVRRFAATLRAGEFNFQTDGSRLYNWLISPLEEEIRLQHVTVLIFSPDASLHVVPFAALYDGKQYAIEKYAIADVAGLTMTNLGSGRKGAVESLVAGMAEPGPVVGKLDAHMVEGILGGADAPARSLGAPAPAVAPGRDGPVAQFEAQRADRLAVMKDRALAAHQRSAAGQPRALGEQERSVGDQARAVGDQERKVGDEERRVGDLARLKSALALPGVRDEVSSLQLYLPGRTMMDSAFTTQGFSDSAGSGDYGIVHIASHGFFGGSADSSFLLAYDDLLTMSHLQSLLTTDKVKQNPIDLLTLSACETAEGSPRAPLGIAGAGIKARARSVVGTLWPVDDDAAKTFMQRFYKGVVEGKVGKAESMRQAQLALLQNPETAHPIFWAPFTLIGNWQ
jgi:CHAT domain-containing protein/tetratricopeptide (TPR) repeat protein